MLLEDDHLLHELTRLDDGNLAPGDREARRATLLAESDAIAAQKRQLLDERARRLGDVLPVGRVRTAPEIQAALQDGELLLEWTFTGDSALLYVLAHDRDVEAIELPAAPAAVDRLLPAVLAGSSRAALGDQRGRDPAAAKAATDAADRSHELFTNLFPAALWERVRGSKRVFVAAHQSLHRLPFELLIVGQKDSGPVYWLDVGPPVSYVQSGSALHWLRTRQSERAGETGALNVLVIGDPALDRSPAVLPEQGVLVQSVNADGQGARVGLQPGDVLTSYDGKPLVDDAALRTLRAVVEKAIQESTRDAGPIAVEVWRNGTSLRVAVEPGPLGILVGQGAARSAHEASLDRSAGATRFVHKNDLERIARLPRLQGARAEAEAIAAAFRGKEANAELLLGERALESAVFDLASKAKYLHFACHGVAEEYAGQSLSMLVLSPPQNVMSEDDGLLKLADLLNRWRGRLSSCCLVVLSACRTNVGPTFRDEAPQALPIGFLFAGVPTVISSLWAVDDASTRELMVDFYGRLLGGETDKLAAFAAAKKALRDKHPDPFHWAPFLFVGSPE